MENTNIITKELLEEALESSIERTKKRMEFINDKHFEWKAEGMKFRKRRENLSLSMAKVGQMLGTSKTRIWRFEVGEPISQVEHLKASYNLLLKHIEMNMNINSDDIIKWAEGELK